MWIHREKQRLPARLQTTGIFLLFLFRKASEELSIKTFNINNLLNSPCHLTLPAFIKKDSTQCKLFLTKRQQKGEPMYFDLSMCIYIDRKIISEYVVQLVIKGTRVGKVTYPK